MARNKKQDGKTNDDAGDAPRKKRGSPSDFAGQRLDFLTAKIPEYIAASKKKKGPLAKTEGLKTFWSELFDVYWKKFPVDLPLDQEPVRSLDADADATPGPMTTEEAFTALGLDQETEEPARKDKVMKETKDVSARCTVHWARR
jgi:hypothetical protein